MYAFTQDPGPLVPERLLYVGKAANLRRRLGGYLVDYTRTAVTSHKGRAFLFEFRRTHGDHRLFLRWVVYGGHLDELESSLIWHLNPQLNDRYECFPLLADDETLDQRMLG